MADLRGIFEDNRGDDWELQTVREKSFFLVRCPCSHSEGF